jgi:hypothetical protein
MAEFLTSIAERLLTRIKAEPRIADNKWGRSAIIRFDPCPKLFSE